MSKPRVLIVEDELVVGLDLEHRLREMGYEVLAVVPSGLEAIDEATRTSPDLVLMDIKLAGDMDGIEAASRIRELIDVPVVFVTAFADETTTRRVKEAAPYGYVVKPFQKEALRAVIETALTRHELGRRLAESERSLREANQSERALRRRLESIDRAGIAVTRALATLGTDVRPFLHAVADEARALADAEYAALGMIDEKGRPFDPWVFAGVDETTVRATGHTPKATGLLGEVIRVDGAIRIRDFRTHASSVGLPPHHPAMTSFLGVPIHYRGQCRGNLYLTNKRGAAEFTEEDEASIRMLADRVGTALEIARLRQIEARERARLEFLAKAGTTLAESLDLGKTLAAIADLIVPSVGDLCTVDLLDEEGACQTVLVRHVDPDRQQALERIPGFRERCGEILEPGRIQIIPDITDEYLERAVPDPAHRDIIRALGLRSLIAVPLVLRGRTIGVLEVSAGDGPRRLREEDAPFVQEIAHLATLAIENARLHQATERREREQRFLSDLGATLASSLDYRETLATAARIAVREVADWCFLDLFEDGRVRRIEVTHADPAKAATCEALEKIDLDPTRAHLAWAVMQTKQAALMRDVSREYLESIAQSEEHLRLLLDLEPRSVMVLPLVVRGRLLGCLMLGSSSAARRYGAADLAFAEHAAHRIALAVDNAELYEIARRAIEARDNVLGVVAHDLRNPLNAILMQAEVLRKHEPDPAPLAAIRRAAKRMNRLIQELLDVARLEGGTFAVAPDPLPTADVVREAVESQIPFAGEALLELSVDLPGGLPEIRGDRDFLGQVFDNLIGNAIKFTKPGGRVTIGASGGDREVLLWVADTGIGVPAADLPHLFDRFWQAKKSDRRGAGLGLSIVKGIVEAHGGRIWVESTVGQGTTVYFTIPVAPRAQRWRSESASHA